MTSETKIYRNTWQITKNRINVTVSRSEKQVRPRKENSTAIIQRNKI